MNVKLQASRQEYWAKVHAIQREHGCTPAEAKRLYKQNGSAPSTATMTIDEVVALAAAKVEEIRGELETLTNRISDLQGELARWGKLRDSITDSPQPVAVVS